MKVGLSYNDRPLGIITSDHGDKLSLSYFRVFYLNNVSSLYYEAGSDCEGIVAVIFTQRFHDIFDIVEVRKLRNLESFPIYEYECE